MRQRAPNGWQWFGCVRGLWSNHGVEDILIPTSCKTCGVKIEVVESTRPAPDGLDFSIPFNQLPECCSFFLDYQKIWSTYGAVTKKRSGATCKRCNLYNEYSDKGQDYVCYNCR